MFEYVFSGHGVDQFGDVLPPTPQRAPVRKIDQFGDEILPKLDQFGDEVLPPTQQPPARKRNKRESKSKPKSKSRRGGASGLSSADDSVVDAMEVDTVGNSVEDRPWYEIQSEGVREQRTANLVITLDQVGRRLGCRLEPGGGRAFSRTVPIDEGQRSSSAASTSPPSSSSASASIDWWIGDNVEARWVFEDAADYPDWYPARIMYCYRNDETRTKERSYHVLYDGGESVRLGASAIRAPRGASASTSASMSSSAPPVVAAGVAAGAGAGAGSGAGAGGGSVVQIPKPLLLRQVQSPVRPMSEQLASWALWNDAGIYLFHWII